MNNIINFFKFLKMKIFYKKTNFEYRLRRLERKLYWKEKYAKK